jgi:hypothetical protein
MRSRPTSTTVAQQLGGHFANFGGSLDDKASFTLHILILSLHEFPYFWAVAPVNL